MFKYLSVKEQYVRGRKENERLKAQIRKNQSDIDYIAMMTDVELEGDEFENETEVETDE